MTKAALFAGLRQQNRCLIHLVGKLGPEHADFRFTPGQRSTIELLRYLCAQNLGFTDYAVSGGWGRWDDLAGATAGLDLAAIPAALTRQQERVEAMLGPWTEERLATRQVPTWWGETVPMIDFLHATALRCTIGYTMQVFLQAKAAGLSGLGSGDLWQGR